jgi:hypothetical protein
VKGALCLYFERYVRRGGSSVRWHTHSSSCSDAVAHASNVASIVICAFSSFDTGHPALALFAMSWNFALSAPGILAFLDDPPIVYGRLW